MIYKLFMTMRENTVIIKLNDDGSSVSFHPHQDNTDYQNFKAQILADEAQLQDADGNVMTDAKDYVKELP